MASLSQSAPPALTSAVHRHTLTLVHTGGTVFKCDGCHQPGADKARYRCDSCDFDLHMPCALPHLQSAIAHPRFGGRHFTFFTSPGASNSRTCDGCGDHVRGFLYHSSNNQGGLDLHPCCASLKETINCNGSELRLHNQAAGACDLCGQDQNGRRGKFWTYASFHGNGGVVNMHVACLLYGDHTRDPGPGRGLTRSISAPSPTQTAITPTQIVTHSPGQMMMPGGNVVATVQTFNTFYSFGKILTEIAGAFTNGDLPDTAGFLG